MTRNACRLDQVSAPRDPAKHDDGYIEFRVADLDPLIEAIIKLQETREDESANWERTYPAPLGSVAEARLRLAQVFDEHVASIAPYVAARSAYRAEMKRWHEQTGTAT
jgi:hypothetical protein